MSPQMKPLKKQTNNAPTPAAIRNRLLHRIRNSELPKDAGKFTLAELRETGLADKYRQTADLPDGHFKTLVLLATQNKELRRERDRLQQEIEENKEYYSPIRDELRDQPDPLKQEEIRKRAVADEERVAREQAAKKQSRDNDWQRLVEAFSRRPWTRRDKHGKPWDAVFWHEPMTIMDYHGATGITRATLKNILRRLKAAPIETRRRKNEPERYGPQTNYGVLLEWLIRYEKNSDHRRAWLVRTLLKTAHAMPDHLENLVGAVMPVFKSLGIENPGNSSEFLEFYRKCEAKLYPPPPPMPADYQGISELLGLNYAPAESVGKIG